MSVAEETHTKSRPRRDLILKERGLLSLLVAAAIGFAVSIYLTVVHYSGASLVCSTTSVINCQAVTTSAYSVLFGTSIPVSAAGIVWFLVSGELAAVGLLKAYRSQAEPGWLRPAQLLWGLGGLIFVLYLVYAEIVLVHRICEWCTLVHLLTLFSFMVALGRLASRKR